MSIDRLELPQGTLDLLILKTVALAPQLTRGGRTQLEAETHAWRRLNAVVSQVLETV